MKSITLKNKSEFFCDGQILFTKENIEFTDTNNKLLHFFYEDIYSIE